MDFYAFKSILKGFLVLGPYIVNAVHKCPHSRQRSAAMIKKIRAQAHELNQLEPLCKFFNGFLLRLYVAILDGFFRKGAAIQETA